MHILPNKYFKGFTFRYQNRAYSAHRFIYSPENLKAAHLKYSFPLHKIAKLKKADTIFWVYRWQKIEKTHTKSPQKSRAVQPAK